MVKTETLDPWRPIPVPDRSATVSARRVDSETPWGMFWAVDVDRSCMIFLQHDIACVPSKRLPNLAGLDLETRRTGDGRQGLVVMRLIDDEKRDIFHRLCIDVISAVGRAETEAEAVDLFIGRTWRWHRLLRSGRDGRLVDDEQKGLVAELNFLRHVGFPAIGVRCSVESWKGPLGAPKDFEIGRVCIEVKARRGAAVPHVSIASEHQLDTDGIDRLFLHVAEISVAPADDPSAVTVTEVASDVMGEVERVAPESVELFDARLLATGFDWMEDYSDKRWIAVSDRYYDVRGEFPRITSSMVPPSVGNLRYSVSLPQCEQYRVRVNSVKSVLQGGSNGD